MSFFNKMYRGMFGWAGDIKKQRRFPYVTWASHSYLMDYDEVLEALPIIEYGDVGLHRDNGYLSNLVVPGFMKHAWLHVEEGMVCPRIIEAVSEGVLYRNAMYPIFSDYTIILSPKEVTEDERKGACLKAQGIVGAQYDVNFKFDIEKELTFYKGINRDEAVKDLEDSSKNFSKYRPTFSCTEAVGYAWWHKREQLRIYRQEVKGRNIIMPDAYLNTSWEIKWMSDSITLDIAKKEGLHEEGLMMIEQYLADK